jgi:hypothetical protein
MIDVIIGILVIVAGSAAFGLFMAIFGDDVGGTV